MTLKQRNIGFTKELKERIEKDIIKQYQITGKLIPFASMVRKRLNEVYGIQEY